MMFAAALIASPYMYTGVHIPEMIKIKESKKDQHFKTSRGNVSFLLLNGLTLTEGTLTFSIQLTCMRVSMGGPFDG